MRDVRLTETLTKVVIVGFSALFPAWYVATKLIEPPAAATVAVEAPGQTPPTITVAQG